MKVVKQKVELLAMTAEPLKLIEAAGRTCYKSEDKITDESAGKFVKMIIKRGHDSVLEHASMTVRITTDRGISHEIVRHRIGMSYSQESTRYVKYTAKVDGLQFDCTEDLEGMEFIIPSAGGKGILDGEGLEVWKQSMRQSEANYVRLIELGYAPQWARSVLPNSLKTEIVVTGNFRSWRHFLDLRMSTAAHPQIREIAFMVRELLPVEVV